MTWPLGPMPTSLLEKSVVSLKASGHVPSFKNSKMLTRGRLITKPENQAWMLGRIDSFASQLLSQYPTEENETVTAENLRSWIASVVPEKDSCRYLTGCSWRFMTVQPGEEAAIVRIESI